MLGVASSKLLKYFSRNCFDLCSDAVGWCLIMMLEATPDVSKKLESNFIHVIVIKRTKINESCGLQTLSFSQTPRLINNIVSRPFLQTLYCDD